MSEREQSCWDWGYAEKFPENEQRRELATRLEGMLGVPERPLLSPPLADISNSDGSPSPPARLSDVVSTRRGRSSRRDWYEDETPAQFREALQAAKESMDAAGIMNPGALLE